MADYLDPVLCVGDELSRRGVKRSAVAEACQQVSQDIIARKWLHIEGEPVYKADGKPPIDYLEYCDQLVKIKPHYLFEEHVIDDADACFLGDGKKRTLKAAGDFVEKYGRKHYLETMTQYGCTETSLAAGTKPTAKDSKPPKRDSTNPYAPGGDPTKRQERIIALIKSDVKLATSLATAAGMRVDGRPLL